MEFVIILGAARSGTTMLANLLKKDPRVLYIGEPRYVWKYKNFHHGHDKLTKEHITSEIRNHIVSFFNNQLLQNEAEILLEKTPSNSLRFEFVYDLFPQAKFIHIIRNGYDVARSAKQRWQGAYTNTELAHKSNLNEISRATNKRLKRKWDHSNIRWKDLLLDLKYSLPLYLNNAGIIKQSIWGPCYPGIRHDFKHMELIEVCSLQWKHSVESVLEFKNSKSFNGAYFEIRYEDIVSGDQTRVTDMFDFAGIELSDCSIKQLKSIKNNYQAEINSDSKDSDLIYKQCHSLLEMLGYHSLS